MNRRTALRFVAAISGYLYGREVGAAAADAQVHGITLALDGLDGIVLVYRGQRVVITPSEIMAAFGEPLAGASAPPLLPRSVK